MNEVKKSTEMQTLMVNGTKESFKIAALKISDKSQEYIHGAVPLVKFACILISKFYMDNEENLLGS